MQALVSALQWVDDKAAASRPANGLIGSHSDVYVVSTRAGGNGFTNEGEPAQNDGVVIFALAWPTK